MITSVFCNILHIGPFPPAALYCISTCFSTHVAPSISCLAGPIDLLGWHQSWATGRNSSASQLQAAAQYSLSGVKLGSHSDLRSSDPAASKQSRGRLWTVNKLLYCDRSLFCWLVKPDTLLPFASVLHQKEKSSRQFAGSDKHLHCLTCLSSSGFYQEL